MTYHKGFNAAPAMQSTNSQNALLILLLVLSNVFYLLNNGVFWDDWIIIYNIPIETTTITFTESGYPHAVLLFKLLHFLFSNQTILPFRITAFCFLCISVFFFEKILRSIREFTSSEHFFLTALFIAISFDGGRASILMVHIYFCYSLFWIGYYLTVHTSDIFNRIIALSFLFLSFMIPSHLVLYAIILLHLFYRHGICHGFFSVKSFFIRHLDYLVLPWLFWILRNVFFSPYGSYSGYNQVTISKLIHAPLNLLLGSMQIFQDLAFKAFQAFHENPFPVILFVFFLTLVSNGFHKTDLQKNPSKTLYGGFFFGITAFACGLFPFAVVGHIPNLTTHMSRYTWELSFGASFIIYFGLKIFFEKQDLPRSFLNLSLAFLLALFTVVNLNDQLGFLYESHKSRAIATTLKDLNIKDQTVFYFKDNSNDTAKIRRPLHIDDFMGIVHMAFTPETRSDHGLFNQWRGRTLKILEKARREKNDLNVYRIPNPLYTQKTEDNAKAIFLTITSGAYPLTAKHIFKLTWLEWTDSQAYLKLLRTTVKLSAETVPPPPNADLL